MKDNLNFIAKELGKKYNVIENNGDNIVIEYNETLFEICKEFDPLNESNEKKLDIYLCKSPYYNIWDRDLVDDFIKFMREVRTELFILGGRDGDIE